MDKVVQQHGIELLSYLVAGNSFMFNEKWRDISSNETLVKSLLIWTSNNDYKHKHSLLMTAIQINNQEIFDILMKNKVCIKSFLCCFSFLVTHSQFCDKQNTQVPTYGQSAG